MVDLARKLEALLFVAGEPLALEYLAKFLKEEAPRVRSALAQLEKELAERGLRLSEKDGEYVLVTAPELGKFIQTFVKEEISRELSRAALETLAVIVYKGPLARSEIDYIRGVNSSWTVRNLMVRGLVERVAHHKDSRIWLYRPSFDFLKFMGVEKLEKLPQYGEFRKEIARFMAADHGGDV
ncbi:MAG: SMC-Scp complex subunit ScpB [bacterium]|nr:SMC-Scp complex subunit ScpB [bacterium]